MKRVVKYFILMIIAILSLALTGCDSNENDNVYGQYYATYVKCNGSDISSTYSKSNMTLNKSGNVVINEIRNGEKNNYRGKFEYDYLYGAIDLVFEELTIGLAYDSECYVITMSQQSYNGEIYNIEFVKKRSGSYSSIGVLPEESKPEVEETNKVYGKYNLTSAYLASVDMDATSILSGTYLELKKDGTGVLYLSSMGQTESLEFEYTEKKNTIEATIEGETISFNYTNGKISFELQGISFVFEK